MRMCVCMRERKRKREVVNDGSEKGKYWDRKWEIWKRMNENEKDNRNNNTMWRQIEPEYN